MSSAKNGEKYRKTKNLLYCFIAAHIFYYDILHSWVGFFRMKEENLKKTTAVVNDKEFKVISVFEGTTTASELLYNLAVKRILNENIHDEFTKKGLNLSAECDIIKEK